MYRHSWLIACCLLLAACASVRREPAPVALAWDERAKNLQHLNDWHLDGRAAVALGTQGWQASLNWLQHGASAEVHLAGPLGVGAVVLKQTPAGLSVNGAVPGPDAVAQLQNKLGFELPLNQLRYWLIGVPDPSAGFELKRTAQDRALQLIQAEWTVDYDRYMAFEGDLLPAHLVLSRGDVRVKIVVDRWLRP